MVVIGGNGFIGTNLVNELLEQGHSVRVFDKLTGTNPAAIYTTGNFEDIEQYKQIFKDVDIVYHLISTTIPDSNRENIEYDIRTNLVATIRMLNIAVDMQVKKIIYVSSGGAIYGENINMHKESDTPHPVYAYGINKLAIEYYLNSFYQFYGLEYTVFRVSNPYGPHHKNKKQGFINVLVEKMKNNEEIEVWGDGSVARDFIYIDDVIDALVKGMNTTKSKIFNISSAKAVSINGVLETIKEVSQKDIKIKYTKARNVDLPINYLDNTLAQKELDWQVKVSLEYGIAKLLQIGS